MTYRISDNCEGRDWRRRNARRCEVGQILRGYQESVPSPRSGRDTIRALAEKTSGNETLRTCAIKSPDALSVRTRRSTRTRGRNSTSTRHREAGALLHISRPSCTNRPPTNRWTTAGEVAPVCHRRRMKRVAVNRHKRPLAVSRGRTDLEPTFRPTIRQM